MKESKLKDRSFVFAVKLVKFIRQLQAESNEYVLTKQLLRSGTAIGALISEGVFAQSRADFISKMSIALKEANETRYWIQLLNATEIINICETRNLLEDITILIAMLVSSIKTAKNNENTK